MLYNKSDVLKFLPHRDPFLFIDSIEKIDLVSSENTEQSFPNYNARYLVGSKVRANFKVTKDLEVLRGHFPGNPVLPGVVQVEMMAQACSFIVYHAFYDSFTSYEIEVALLSVDRARFKKAVIPDQELILLGELIKGRGSFQTYDVRLENLSGELICSAEIMATLTFKKRS